MGNPTYDALSEAETHWVGVQLDAAAQLIETLAPGTASQPFLSRLDQAFAAFVATGPTSLSTVNGVINAFGAALGEAWVRDAGFEWIIASADDRTDLAVVALRGRGDVLAFPGSLVAKRWQHHDSPTFTETFTAVVSERDRIAGARGESER